MAFISKSLDVFWNGLDTTLQTLIPERVLNILGMLQPAFNFTASKFVVIKDWRLGAILRVFQVAVMIYLFVSIFRQASYLQTEPPTGVVSPFVQTGNRNDRVAEFQSQDEESGSLPYCDKTNGTYDFSYNGQDFNGFSCMFSDVSSLSKKGESRFFVTTYTTMYKTLYTGAADNTECEKVKPEGFKRLLFLDKIKACVFWKRENFFPIGVEKGKLSLLHGFSTSIVKKSDYLPTTIVRNTKTGEERVFEEGTVVNMEIGEWLKIAGVDLDKRMNDNNDFEPADGQKGEGAYTDQYPIVRLSGVTIVSSLKYYERRLAPDGFKKSSGKKARDIICIMDVAPRYIWSLQGADIRHMVNDPAAPIFLSTDGDYSSFTPDNKPIAMQVDFQNYGIEFSFQTGGNVGRFSFSSLISALVAGSVMLGVAQTVVVFVALYGMGLSSQLYMEFMRESVDWRKEYARFAAQALVAGYAFMGYDENNSFKLDRKEVFKTLKLILGQRLPEDRLAALADFVMRQGEEDSKVSKGAFRLEKGDMPASNLISIEEWIGIFTQEKVSLAALERLIENEYKDDRTRDFLVRAAHGVRMRGLPGDDDDDNGDDEDEHEDDVDPEILAYQQSAKRRMTQAFLANMQQGPTGRSDDPDIEDGVGK